MRFKLINFKKIFASLGTVCLAASLAACGGGGGSYTPYVSPVEGFYQGSLTNSGTANSIQMIVLEDESFWSVYGLQTGAGLLLTGFVQGQGGSYRGSFTSSNMRDYGTYPAVQASLSATYGGGSLGGAWDYSTYSLGFSAGKPATSYNYWQPADLLSLVGDWTLTTVSKEPLNFRISPGGQLSSISGPCAYSGWIHPRESGHNVLDISFTFTSGACALLGQTVQGIAISSPLGGGPQQLTLAAVDSTRIFGLAATGVR